jgi:hypothetical protein
MRQKADVSVAQPMKLGKAISLVARHAAILDTRGYLSYLLEDHVAARRDLELAVTMIESVAQAYAWEVDANKHYLVDIRPLTLEKRGIDTNIAVIRYHRMLVYEALGLEKEVQADRARIIELGREPGEQLF